MNTSPALSPLSSMRRRHQWRIEPLVFAVVVTMLILGINLSDTPAHTERADQQPAASQVASAR